MPDKVAIITGAATGIGRATAELLAAAGFRVVLVGRREHALEQAARGMAGPGETLVVAADVSQADSAGEVIRRTIARFGRLDVLVNNAGTAPLASIDKTTPEMLRECFAVNALGPGYLIAAAWPEFMRQAEEAKGRAEAARATIVNVSSMATKDPFGGFFAYAAAKASVNLMAQVCAKEGAGIGVRAFAVAPGAVETAMLRGLFSENDVPRTATLDAMDVARVIAACVNGERDAENGRVIWVARA
jgi:NAD(P)-dependent dehydrogenase (short-subunit alcohol dehydrogenase family)